MPVSSSVLIHQTDKKGLIGILNDSGFIVKYCHDKVIARNGHSNLAYPIVSFTDLPLTSLKIPYGEPGGYGDYGIGLKKDWARRNGMNPVFYVDSESNLIELINGARKKLLSDWQQRDNYNIVLHTSVNRPVLILIFQ